MRSPFTKKAFKPYLKRVVERLLSEFPQATKKFPLDKKDGDKIWIVNADHNISYRIVFYETFIAITVHYLDETCDKLRSEILLDYFEEVRLSKGIFIPKQKQDEHDYARNMGVGPKWNIQGAMGYDHMEDLFYSRVIDMKYNFPKRFYKWVVNRQNG